MSHVEDFPFPELEAHPAAISAFVARENARTEAEFPHARRAADEAAIRAILEAPDDLQWLSRRAPFIYAFRKTAKHPRGVWLRLPEDTPITPDAPWETVFDLDAFCAASGGVWVWVGAQMSPFDPSRALISLSEEGSDLERVIEFDVERRSVVPGGFDLGPSRGAVAWAGPDSLILSSAASGDTTRSGWAGALRRLERGEDASEAKLICRTDPNHVRIECRVSRFGGTEWIEAQVEVIEFDMERVTLLRQGEPPLILPNPADTAPLFNHAFCVWIANQQGKHSAGSLVLCRHDGTEERVLFEPEPGTAVRPEDVFFNGDWLVWTEMRQLTPHVMALDTRDPKSAPREIVPPVEAETIWVFPFDLPQGDREGTLILTATGYLLPRRVWLFDLPRGVEEILFRPLHEAPAHFDASGCRVELRHATSDDGTRVPYRIVLPKGHEGRSDIPVLLHGYGGFAISMEPSYLQRFGKTWVGAGCAYVEAHIRGGGEFGPDWHLQAKGAGRHKAFEDFAAVAADLVARGFTTPQRIACHGVSNGGLLCGVMLTRYPGRFGAVWASVGVYDMLNYTRFAAGKAWIDEYGDPDEPEERAWLRAYSPIHNIPEGPLPPVLIDTSHRDDRVDPSHSRRFVAALQAAGHRPYFIEHRGGHGGGSASYETAREMALGFAFLRRALQIDQ